MNWKLLPLLILIAGIGIFILSRPRVPRKPVSLAELERAISKFVTHGSPPALSVVVLKGGQSVYNRNFGWADAPAERLAGPETVYHWWSLTKIPTALAILQLRDQGSLDLEDRVSDYLPFFQVELDGEPYPHLTIRQLLRHTSGLPDPMPAMIGWVHYEDELYNQTELLEKHLPDYNQLKFAPDAKASYSNLGYMALGAIIEVVSGENYETYIQKNVFNPLGMTGTGFLYTSSTAENAAAGSHPIVSIYTPLLPFLLDMDALVKERGGARYWFNPVYIDTTPPSGLIGTASDAALLGNALLLRDDLLSAESHDLLLPRDGSPTGRPLGWAEYNLDGRVWVQHQGGGPGFATLMRLYPEENLGIVLMANSTHLPSNALAVAFAELNW